MAKKRKKFLTFKSRGIEEDHGPGLFNPFRSVQFADRKKKANKEKARKKTNYED